MRIGYARVSTTDQNLTSQLEALKAAQCSKIFREKVSTRDKNRPELERMLDQIRLGDVLIVTKLDRLARSTFALLEIIERIQEAGASFLSLGEPWADTSNHAGKLIMTVFAGIAEFERERIRERCTEGRANARKAGVRFGRTPILSQEQKAAILKLRMDGTSTTKLGKLFSVSTETIRRLLTQEVKA